MTDSRPISTRFVTLTIESRRSSRVSAEMEDQPDSSLFDYREETCREGEETSAQEGIVDPDPEPEPVSKDS
jgi:hypothetical protein